MNKPEWKPYWNKRRDDVFAMLFLVLFFLLFFGWIFLRANVSIGGDAFSYCYPLRSVAWSALRHGQLPLWTPAILSGYPLLSMTTLGLGYPLTWLYLFLPGYVAEQIYLLLPYLLAPAFTYAYAREIGRSRLASLLAGLSYGYGGASTNMLGLIGFPLHSLMWLPVLLIALERSRRGRFGPAVAGASFAYALSVLNGFGQAFFIVGVVALAYGIALALTPRLFDSTWSRWRPLVTAICAIAFGSGVAAFQILETLRAARRSMRNTLGFYFFATGSFPPALLLKSFIAPLYVDRFADVTAYVSPLVFALGLIACVLVWRKQLETDLVRVCFWFIVAGISALVMLGNYLPPYRFLYHVPFVNQFRVPSRHAFEWTFSLSILGAYGWDLCFDSIAQRRPQLSKRFTNVVLSLSALLLGVLTSWLWWRATIRDHLPHAQLDLISPRPWYSGLSVLAYGGFKTAVAACILLALWLSFRLTDSTQKWFRMALIGLICFPEPYILVTNWWNEFVKPPSRLRAPSPVTNYLQGYPPENNRVYTRFTVFEDDSPEPPVVDAQNMTALYGVQNVAGYDPLLLDRYSRALGNVTTDGVNPLPGYSPNDTILAKESHVLDLLNTTFIVSYKDLNLTRSPSQSSDQFRFNLNEAVTDIRPQTKETISITDTTADSLALVTSLANSVDIQQGTPVARLEILTDAGNLIQRDLLAGVNTAEWAHERNDVKPVIRHTLAAVFDRHPGDSAYTYEAYRFVTRIDLGSRVKVKQIQIVNLTNHATLALWAASLVDSAKGESEPQSRKLFYLRSDPERWEVEKTFADVMVLRNKRAQPRVWLVGEAEAVDGEQALERIQGRGTRSFDPRRTVLLEVRPEQLPALPGGELAAGSTAHITNYEPNHLAIETNAATATVLVVSEIFYPGWEATVDGQPTRIAAANFLLRGVSLSSGHHRVEMRYTAPAARTGFIISLLTLGTLAGLVLYSRRRVGTEGKENGKW
jgi:hypothetical protein